MVKRRVLVGGLSATEMSGREKVAPAPFMFRPLLPI